MPNTVMPNVAGPSTEPASGADRQRKGRWKRAQQVCTNCRQMKLRCDFQERFPEPCTRCATSSLARGMPCHVDPSFRRVTKRAGSPEATGADASFEQSPDPMDGPPEVSPTLVSSPPVQKPISNTSPKPHLPTPAPSGAGTSTEEPLTPSSASPADSSPSMDRAIGSITLTGDEVTGIFKEFFTYYHPFIRVILHPSSPDDTYDQSHYLFWAICSIGARPRPEHPVPRARTGDLCVELGKEVKSLFCQILGERCRTHKTVQALILICEFPFARPQGRDGFIWTYTGMAITMGLQIGMHRPKFVSEYAALEEQDRSLEHEEVKERVLTWIQCFNVHQGLASLGGFPGLMADDWVLLRGATRPLDLLCTRVFDYPDVFRILRIHRLARRLNHAVGNDPNEDSGQLSSTVRGPLLAVFAAELSDLEATLKPTPGPSSSMANAGGCQPRESMSPIVAVRLLEAKLQLYTFELQDGAATASGEDLLICYTSSVRIMGILSDLHKTPGMEAIYWPRSLYASFIAAILCLLKLAGLHIVNPRKIQIDRAVILKEISIGYEIIKTRSICPGDTADRRARGIQFLCSRLQAGTVPFGDKDSGTGVNVRSRMSLGGLLYDSIKQIRAMRKTQAPQVDAIFETLPKDAPLMMTAKSPEADACAPSPAPSSGVQECKSANAKGKKSRKGEASDAEKDSNSDTPASHGSHAGQSSATDGLPPPPLILQLASYSPANPPPGLRQLREQMQHQHQQQQQQQHFIPELQADIHSHHPNGGLSIGGHSYPGQNGHFAHGQHTQYNQYDQNAYHDQQNMSGYSGLSTYPSSNDWNSTVPMDMASLPNDSDQWLQLFAEHAAEITSVPGLEPIATAPFDGQDIWMSDVFGNGAGF